MTEEKPKPIKQGVEIGPSQSTAFPNPKNQTPESLDVEKGGMVEYLIKNCNAVVTRIDKTLPKKNSAQKQ